MQEANLSPEVLSETLKSVLKLLECPVCHKVPKIPCFRQCKGGHVLCQECTENQVQCLELNCKQKFIIKEPLIYRGLLEVLPRKCENKECTSFITSRNDHLLWCVLGETTCLLCPKYSCLRHELLDHLHQIHAQSIVSVNYIEFTVNGFTGDVVKDTESVKKCLQSCGVKVEAATPFYIFEDIFWLTCKISDKDISLQFESFVVPLGPAVKTAFCCTVEIAGMNRSGLVYSKLMKEDRSQNNITISTEITLEKIVLCEFIGNPHLNFKITFSKSVDSELPESVHQTQQSVNGPSSRRKSKSVGEIPQKKSKTT